MPFAPEVVFPPMVAMRERYPAIFTQYGCRDSLYPPMAMLPSVRMGSVVAGVRRVARDHLGINQGPIVAMIENHRSESIWKTMRRNRYITSGLHRAAFTGGWLDRASVP